jgi:hypothetical protein
MMTLPLADRHDAQLSEARAAWGEWRRDTIA